MNKKTVNRRQFMRLAGFALAACTLSCAGLTLFMAGEEKPETTMTIGFPDLTLGDRAAMRRILVAYASANGSTGGVAEIIGQTLAEHGAAVYVQPLQSVTTLEGYHAVVVGSAIHGGKWLPEAVKFVQTHEEALRRLPTTFFLVGMMVASKSEATQTLVAQFLAEERALVEPAAEGRFVGAMFPNQYPFFTGLGMRFFMAYCGLGLRGGDYRDKDAVQAWAEKIYSLLIQQS